MEDYTSWSILTTNFIYVLYIALGGVTLASVLHLVNGQWRFDVRFLAVSTASLFPLAFVLLLILLANGDTTFAWKSNAHDLHLPGWMDYSFLVIREIAGFLVVALLFGLFIKYQHKSSIDDSYAVQRRFRNIALLIPFAYFLYGTMVAWDFEMTMWPGWHSASYGAYHFQSNFHMFLAFFTVFLFFLNRSGKLTHVIENHVFNKLAQFMLAMTILWTYLYFTQYLIMWYGRFPEEMARYDNMMYVGYPAIWWVFLTLKFIIPFCTLAITPNRHNPVIITMVASSILLGTWLERYTWIAGSVEGGYHTPMTGMFDISVTAGIFVIAWLTMKWVLTRFRLLKETA